MPPEATSPVAWMSGAAGGIGRAVTERLCGLGWRVHATDLNVTQAGNDTGQLHWERVDVLDEDAVGASFVDCIARAGRLDAVVHLAGAVGRGPLAEMSLEGWRHTLDLNLTSAFLVARAAYAALKDSRGTLVLMSSTNGLSGGTVLSGPAYAAAKAGVVNLTRYLAKEWAPDQIRVNCVAPGPVETPMLRRLDDSTRASLGAMTPLGRVASAQDVAGTIAFLLSEDAGFLTGTVHNISGGLFLD
ncbi:MAG: SDR family oxidoreductase [Gammaproteobacteria bacterium]|nr:SDR family oxidoreductase [Gammaproteobacteria bacterium]